MLVFFLLRALVCDLRLDGSPVHALACAVLRGLRRAVLVVLRAVPLVFVFAGRWERDGRCHARIVESGMWGVWTWELEGGGKMFGVRVGGFFEQCGEGSRRDMWRLVERVLLRDDGSVLGNGCSLFGSLSFVFVDVRVFLLRLFGSDLGLVRTDDRLLGDDRRLVRGNRLLP